MIATLTLTPGLLLRLPLMATSLSHAAALMAASFQHAAVSPEFIGSPYRADCKAISHRFKEFVMPREQY